MYFKSFDKFLWLSLSFYSKILLFQRKIHKIWQFLSLKFNKALEILLLFISFISFWSKFWSFYIKISVNFCKFKLIELWNFITQINFLKFINFQVRWVQQQHEKIRKKRDYKEPPRESRQIKFPDYNSDLASLLRQLAPQARVQYRNTDSHSIFSDPLFKEQWYLVSRVCVAFVVSQCMMEWDMNMVVGGWD